MSGKHARRVRIVLVALLFLFTFSMFIFADSALVGSADLKESIAWTISFLP